MNICTKRILILKICYRNDAYYLHSASQFIKHFKSTATFLFLELATSGVSVTWI
jgi:hypothetical protein